MTCMNNKIILPKNIHIWMKFHIVLILKDFLLQWAAQEGRKSLSPSKLFTQSSREGIFTLRWFHYRGDSVKNIFFVGSAVEGTWNITIKTCCICVVYTLAKIFLDCSHFSKFKFLTVTKCAFHWHLHIYIPLLNGLVNLGIIKRDTAKMFTLEFWCPHISAQEYQVFRFLFLPHTIAP